MSSAARRRIVYLARHGETEWNLVGRWQGQTDIGLNDRGREQARALAERLRDRGVARVRASDLARARETAEIVARALGAAGVSLDPGLRERGYGVFEGLTREECEAQHPVAWASYMADRRFSPPGAEPQEALVQRMREAMQRAHAEEGSDAEPLLIVSHGGSIRALLASFTGTHPPPLDNGAVIEVAVTATTVSDPSFVE